MERPLVLHQINAMDVAPPAFVRVAAEAGCEAISVFTNCPNLVLPGQTARLDFPTISPRMKFEMLDALAGNGVEVAGVEYFPIVPEHDVREYIPGLALGRALGGSRAVTHVHDTNSARAVESLGLLCELAAAEGLGLGVEFTPMTGGCRSLEQAVWFVDQVGRSDFAIGMDCLHFVRSGATVEALSKIDSRYFNNIQICDGHGLQPFTSYMDESHDRELPGKGDFPLVEILNALPADIPIEIEVPSSRYRAGGVSALDHVRNAIAHTRAVVAKLEPVR